MIHDVLFRTAIFGLLDDDVRANVINHHRYVRARVFSHGCASKCTHVAQCEDNGSRCGLSNSEANEVNGRPSPSPRNHGVSERPRTSLHLTHLLSHHTRSLAEACVTLFLYVDPAAALLYSLSSPALVSTLRSFRYVLTADARRDATVFLSLSRLTSVSNTAQVRYSSRPPRSRVSSSTFSVFLRFLLSLPSVYPEPSSRSFSLYAYFIALLALHFHPRVFRLPSWRFLRLYRGRGSMSLSARRSEYS